jgi:2-C-methyl-D-erythritol 4-phosphate cytidylyltransferase/2-C-methyl-D-erythritol 2,4-cyclodiphosphate synthase
LKVGAVIVAAGHGSRYGGGQPKQYADLLGRPVLRWSVDALEAAGVSDLVVVAAPEATEMAAAALAGAKPAIIVPGGATRTASVRAGLAALPQVDVILVHDAARPGLTPAMITQLTDAVAAGAVAVAPALPLSDALARQNGEEVVRTGLLRVQTPQAFAATALRQAHERAPLDVVFADDLAVMRAAGHPVQFVPGDPSLMKITFPGDLEMAARLLNERVVCVGNGYDAHRFGDGDHVILCGVRIAHERGLMGHSDADAGWHALVDALLGAVGEGDIGVHFPPSDPRWKGAASETFLRHAKSLVEAIGAEIVHVDITLVCERPRVSPHREAMRARTAEVLSLPLTRVSVKATTTERMGFTGREEGLAAIATATVERPRR